MVEHLFLYEKPFVVTNSKSNFHTYLCETIRMSDFERDDEKQLREIIFKFAIDNNILRIAGNQVIPNPVEDTGSWIWAVNWTNFRSLVDMNQYSRLMNSLQAQDGNPVTLIIDLYTRIGMLFDHELLNTVVNRTIKTVSLIPYEVKDKTNLITWERIHLETPFLWLIIFMQTIIRSEARRLM